MCDKLTKNNITSLLALIIVPPVTLCSCAVMIYLFVTGETTQGLSIFSALIGITGAVSGHYFGSKASDKATKVMLESHRSVLESREREINTLRGIDYQTVNL